jgi:hypothetical protein
VANSQRSPNSLNTGKSPHFQALLVTEITREWSCIIGSKCVSNVYIIWLVLI